MLDDIRQWLATRPFVPFRLCMTDGWAHVVTEPDLCTAADETLTVYRRKPGSQHGRVPIAVVAVGHVLRVEDAEDDGVPY